jgi:outer membrane protein assembly factor BamB
MYRSKNQGKIDIALLVFKTVLVVLVFLAGGYFAKKNWQPFKFIDEAFEATVTVVEEQTQVRPVLLVEGRYSGDGVYQYDEKQAYNGLTVLQGTLPGGPQLRLIDMLGREIHRWPVDFFDIWPNPEHLLEKQRPKSTFNYHTQGMVVFPDGSVLVNVSGKGAAKLDKCGEVLWTIDHMTHHSITPIDGGGYWIPSHRSPEDVPGHLIFAGITRKELLNAPPGQLYQYENLILRVAEGGEVIGSFSILQALYDAGLESAIDSTMYIKPSDPTHLNDIVIVTPELAARIDDVEAGDLLLSLRQMKMLVIIDDETGVLKWHYIGPWIYQHDPDITAEGNIVVYNNSNYWLSFNRKPGSNLVELDPATGKTRIIYPLGDQPAFVSELLGAHELLPNGNRLIVESRAGRVFEINPEGDIVWDFIKPYDETFASLIAYAERVDVDFFKVDDWQCD